ncbi:LPXTG-motif cell wall-anchored protein [Metabacillus crassostreae]|uniref:leucine-rich repeat domain-containing protein n=1 Tax=Metabacillus crassostreae TaxID=929098 RepID=UPI00195A1430|nr:leucine-rich repeat domain-containing protein [Metabacillus crassostreae]MBM7606370.1 LPXTG-motif cell wall-anchored protein [Metabacillus crassostreae]
MNKRLVSISLIFTVLLTLFTPFSQKVIASTTDSISLLPPAVNTEEGVQLQWVTSSSIQGDERFTLIKNNEDIPLTSIENVNSTVGENGEVINTYQFLDKQVEEGKNYTYSVKKVADSILQTEQIEITYQKEQVVQENIDLHVTNITDLGFKAEWSTLQNAEVYHLVLDGKLLGQFKEEQSYEIKEVAPNTSYTISVRAIKDGEVLSEATKTVTTLASEISAEQLKDDLVEEPKVTKKRVKATATATATPSGEVVTIPDLALKRAVKGVLKLTRDEIYTSDMERLTNLNASDINIKDLTGLEAATNLTKLELSGNEINSAAELEKLTKLEYLDLSYYKGTDIEFLSSLSNLKTLIISDTIVKNIEPISNLSLLETLDISFGQVTELSALTALSNLRELNISYLEELTSIATLQQLTNLTTLVIFGDIYVSLKAEVDQLKRAGLEIVHDETFYLYFDSMKVNENRAILNWSYDGEGDVAYYEVKVGDTTYKIDAPDDTLTVNDLNENTQYQVTIRAFNSANEVLSSFETTIKTLVKPTEESKKVIFKDLQLEKAIKNHFGLDRDIYESDMVELTELSIERKRIKDLTGLEKATNLAYLYAPSNVIEDITPISSLKNLQGLYLDTNPITDFSALSELSNLTSLGLTNTGIKDLSVLTNLNKLNDLNLDENEITSLSALPALPNLVYLSIYNNMLTNLEGIEKLAKLESLYIDDNPLESLAGINTLIKLNSISLSNTNLVDISELLQIDSLQNVSLYNNEKLDLNDDNSDARKVIAQLEEWGVYVDYDFHNEEEWFEAYISFITENSLLVHWDYYGEKEIENIEIHVDGEKKSSVPYEDYEFKITDLDPNTEYRIDVKAFNSKGELEFTSSTTETTWSEPSKEVAEIKDENLKELIKDQLGLDRDPRVSDMEKLDSIYLYESEVSDLTGLEYAVNLFDFNVSDNTEELDLTPLKNLQNLYSIYITNTSIKDYAIFKDMKNIRSLSIDNNNLEDLSFLSGMKQLEDLMLMNNNISDITVLSGLTKLAFVNLANNKIEDIRPLLGSKDHMYTLDLSGNPIKDISSLSQFENLFDLYLDQTLITDLTPLLELYSLESVSLYNIPSLDLPNDVTNQGVIDELLNYGVTVNIDVDLTPELTIDEVTQNSISISWDPMLPKGTGEYDVKLYKNYGEEIVKELKLDSAETSYQFTELLPNTDYYIEVSVEEEEAEYYGYLSAEVTTLPVEGSIKDVTMYVEKTEGVPEVEAMFDLYGIDESNEEVYHYGWSDEEGKLWDYTLDEPVDIFALPVGNYGITFITADDEEKSFEFEIIANEEYLVQPIIFLLDEGEDDEEVTSPGKDGEDRDDNDNDDKDPNEDKAKPIKVSEPKKEVKLKVKPVGKEELPKTATDVYNLMMIGLVVISLGGVILFIRKRKGINNG